MQLIDSHIHLDFPAFEPDRDTLIENARSEGITEFVVPATGRKSWRSIYDLSQSYPNIYPAYGIHPYFVADHDLGDCVALDQWLQANSCVAVGEIGLDYYLQDLDRDHQLQLFEAQLKLAVKHRLPVILHARKAIDAVTQQLKIAGVSGGIVHSFNGSYVQAMRLIEMGFKLGFGGALTYPRATRLRALVKQLPLDSLCLETDAPDQAVYSLQGQRNLPVSLLEVLMTIAEIRRKVPEIIAKHALHNTYAALNIC